MPYIMCRLYMLVVLPKYGRKALKIFTAKFKKRNLLRCCVHFSTKEKWE
jgi:hypothetical protein